MQGHTEMYGFFIDFALKSVYTNSCIITIQIFFLVCPSPLLLVGGDFLFCFV